MNKTEQSVYTNRKEYEDYDEFEENISRMKELGRYAVIVPKLSDYEGNLPEDRGNGWIHQIVAGIMCLWPRWIQAILSGIVISI